MDGAEKEQFEAQQAPAGRSRCVLSLCSLTYLKDAALRARHGIIAWPVVAFLYALISTIPEQ